MSFDSIYKNEPYFFEIEKDAFEGGDEIVFEILKNAGIDTNDFSISFVASNQDYDVYRANSEKNSYCIKYSMDSKNSSIKREFDILNLLPNYSTAKAAHYGSKVFGDTIHYSIVSFEKAFDLKSLGISLIMENLDEFFIKYNSLQQENLQLRSYNEHLNDFLNSVNINNLPQESIEAIESFSDLNLIKQTIKSVEEELFVLSDPKVVRKNSLCHGRLKASNILFNQGTFKFVDFTESYLGNVYLDLSAFCIYSGFNEERERFFLDCFIKSNGKTPCQQDYFEYEVCNQISQRKIFLEILTQYLKEVYVFSSSRPMKILDLVDLFARNNNKFFKIASVKKHYEFIYKSILEPVLSFK
jgi:hypothetical protein